MQVVRRAPLVCGARGIGWVNGCLWRDGASNWGMEAVSLFHSWWRRYSDRLHAVDPEDLLG